MCVFHNEDSVSQTAPWFEERLHRIVQVFSGDLVRLLDDNHLLLRLRELNLTPLPQQEAESEQQTSEDDRKEPMLELHLLPHFERTGIQERLPLA